MIEKENLKNSRVAIIDADSIGFIIGWNYKDSGRTDQLIEHTDDFIHSILQATQCRYYIGLLSPKDTPEIKVANFRETIAVSQPYKGNREEKPDWFKVWGKVVEDRLEEKWGFIRGPHDVETDDVVVALHRYLNTIETCTPYLCANDKDTKQSPGHQFNLRTNTLHHYTEDEASYNLFYQVLMGDKTDNIPGLPGVGKVTAEKILTAEGIDQDNRQVAVLYEYTKRLGVDKGIQMFYEQYMLCKMRDELPVEHYTLLPYDLEGNAVRTKSASKEEPEEDIHFNFEAMGSTDTGLFKIGEDE